MNEKITTTQKLNILKPIYCPQTGKRIVAEKDKQFEIPNGTVTWFHCEACQGWHTIITTTCPAPLQLHIPED